MYIYMYIYLHILLILKTKKHPILKKKDTRLWKKTMPNQFATIMILDIIKFPKSILADTEHEI